VDLVGGSFICVYIVYSTVAHHAKPCYTGSQSQASISALMPAMTKTRSAQDCSRSGAQIKFAPRSRRIVVASTGSGMLLELVCLRRGSDWFVRCLSASLQ